MKGIVYKYQSPNGKCYIGQTVNESKRRNVFLRENEDYAGVKINNARKKYGAKNFSYEVLEVIERDDIDELSKELDSLEEHYIEIYDSFKNGYNMSIGGDGSRGYKITQEHKEKIKYFLTHNNPFKGRHHTDKVKRIISEANGKPVKQIDTTTGEVLRVFPSAKIAGETLGHPRGNCEIIKVCKHYVSPSNRHFITALGYKWEYCDSEGSTTNEAASEDAM